MRGFRPLPLLGLAVVCAAGVATAYALLVRTHRGQRIDQGAFDGRGLATPGAHDAAQQLLTTISVGTLAIACAVLLAQALVRRRVTLAVVAGTAIGGAVLTTQLLKRVLARPDLLIDGRLYENSFPSGHATIAFAVGIAATLVAPPAARRLVSVVAVAYAAAVGIATIAAGWHRPSDVAGAFLVAGAWAAVAAVLDGALAGRARSSSAAWARPRIARGWLHAGGALLLAGYVAALAVVAAGRAGAVEWTALDAAFLGSCVAVAALAAFVMAALLAAVRASLPVRLAPARSRAAEARSPRRREPAPRRAARR